MSIDTATDPLLAPGHHLVDVDTRATRAQERADSWNRAISRASVPINVFSRDENGFVGKICADEVGSLRVVTIKADAQTVVRTPQLARSGGHADFYKLIFHLSGSCRISQDDRTANLQQRALVVSDTTRPYSLDFLGPYRHQVLMIPRDVLTISSDAVATITATATPVDRGAARVLSRLMRGLNSDVYDLSERNRLAISETLIELSEAVLRDALGSALTTAESGRFAEVLAYIENHLSEPGLTPGAIASAHFMSLRSLQLLFQSRNESPSSWIRKRRLESARRDLVRPGSREPISLVAARWGFREVETFTRAFKRAFGMPPVAYRNLYTTPTPLAGN
ncbi:helix-turn-helix domain-containing protein [Pseudonocardia acaciae]|uniref:AraC-like ligand-binding domain-containing protein n=1 Tax=Pseudonocardia acaciae TaxID=551276 RepID=UPI00048E6C5A|nr:helix-turn-helix domain-containing protein [Pseudonocardia acaciae]